MMSNDEISEWIKQEARNLNRQNQISATFLRREGDYLYFAMQMKKEIGNAYERAEVLQKLEDLWEEKHADAEVHLLLIPGSTN